MSEPKTQCVACGAPILQLTTDKYDALCVPCHRKAAAIPPEDFEIPPDLAQRLVSINRDPMDWREEAWQRGADYVHGLIDGIEETNRLYDEWSPRLRQFARKCREECPPPTDDSLSSRDRGMQRIYEAKFARPLQGQYHHVAICRMPLIAIRSHNTFGLGLLRISFS